MNTIEVGFWVVAALVALAVAFDFMNGFHDAANSIATVVSTGVLKPQQAIVFAAFFNVVAIFIFHLNVAATIGKGIVLPGVVDHHVVFGALIGAIFWNLVTWWYGIPSSSSHALIGGIVGAVIAKAGFGALVARRCRQDGAVHLRLAAARLPARLAVDGRGREHLPARVAAQGRQPVPPPAARLGRPVQPGPRRQRRAEDDRHHLDAADRDRLLGRGRCVAARLGHLVLLPGDRPRHHVRRLAHRQDDGPEDHEAEAGRRLLRRDRRRLDAVPGDRPGHPGLDDPHDHRRDRRRRGRFGGPRRCAGALPATSSGRGSSRSRRQRWSPRCSTA